MTRRKSGFFIGEAISRGWQLWKEQWLAWTGVVIVALVTPYLPGAFGMALGDEAGLFTIVLLVATFLLSVLVSMGLLRISLLSLEEKPIQIIDLFGEWKRLPAYLVGSLLYGLIVFGGTLLFIIPGFLWAITFQYYAFLILEGKNPMEALRESARLTAGRKLDLFALQYVLSTVVMLGSLIFGVGVLVAIPISLIANALIYRKLQR